MVMCPRGKKTVKGGVFIYLSTKICLAHYEEMGLKVKRGELRLRPLTCDWLKFNVLNVLKILYVLKNM